MKTNKNCYIYMVEKNRRLEKCEKIFKKILNANNITHLSQVQFRMKIEGNKTKIYVVDFLVGNTIIEIDGSTHNHKKQIEYDNKRDERFKKYGYNTIRITNDEIFTAYLTICDLKEKQKNKIVEVFDVKLSF